MIIQSANFRLKLEEILEEESIPDYLSETEKKVMELIRVWDKPNAVFRHQTSGSTGKAKTISIPKEKIIYSAEATLKYLDPQNKFKNTLLCLNPAFIGGAMVVYRALHRGLNLYITEPDAYQIPPFITESIDLASMVPLQYEKLSVEEKYHFNVILIGGAPISIQEDNSTATCYATFGMTETVSHFALRNLNTEYFETIGDSLIKREADGTLSIKGSLTDQEWLKTNDIIELIEPNKFRWLGRKDFVINSGGIKFNPEMIESKIRDQFSSEFLILYKPDPELHQRLVLVTQDDEKVLDMSSLSKYERPKEIFFNFEIPHTEGGKPDRRQAQELILRR